VGEVGLWKHRGVCKQALNETIVEENLFKREFPRETFRFQACLYRKVVVLLYPDDLPALFCRRVASSFPDVFARISVQSFLAAKVELCKFPKTFAQQILRTWAFGWCTSRRMHEPICLPCLFCCGAGSDCQVHYFSCFKLWEILGSIDGEPLPADGLAALGVESLSVVALVRVVAASLAYHHVRASRFSEIPFQDGTAKF